MGHVKYYDPYEGLSINAANRLRAALEDLQAKIVNGMEFPDAVTTCAIIHQVSTVRLTRAYDLETGAT